MDELELLKQRADTLGIKYSPNIGVDALRAKVDAAQSGEPTTTTPVVSGNKPLHQLRQEMQQSELALVRLRIANLNPDKKDLHGEIFTVANKIIGTVRVFVPYGEKTDDGWHIPNIIYKQLKARKFLQVRVLNRAGGHTEVEQKWVPEFALEVLPPLTQDELDTLAIQQAAANGGR